MIEHTIAQYIAANSEHVLGEDLAAYDLPEGAEEGLFVRMSSEQYSFGALVNAFVTIFITYDGYYKTREVADEVRALMVAMKGLDGWTTGGDVTVTSLGENKDGYCLFSVVSRIRFEGDS